MGLLRTREILTVFLLIQSTTSDSSSLGIVATCRHEEIFPQKSSYFNPSPIHNLTATRSESLSSVIVRWAINIDKSIHSLTGTWITFGNSNYRCQYNPPFTSNQINLSGVQQLWFNLTVPNVCPLNKNDLYACNLPIPLPGTGDKYFKTAQTAPVQWNPNISTVDHGDEVLVIFNTISAAEKQYIQLKTTTDTLGSKEEVRCKEENCEVKLEYVGPCEDLNIWITTHFKNCQHDVEIHRKVDCKKLSIANRSVLVTAVGITLGLLLMLLVCCVTRQAQRWARESKGSVSVRVLIVYPAVDGVFQSTVIHLAEFLQSRGGVSVVIDLWDKVSLADQGPLRWINTQTELADRVLIVPPPQITHTGDLKSNPVPSAVSASASNLFALTLNLVSSAAHEPHGRDKFWVVHVNQEESGGVQPELRGLRMFVLPRDQEKLHQQLLKGNKKISALLRSFKTFSFRNTLDIKHSGAAGHRHSKLANLA